MPNAIDSFIHTIGQPIWELRITGETAGDTPLDVPVDTTKRHRIYGMFNLATNELLEKIGTSIQGDAVLFTREELDLTSQIEYKDVIYEIQTQVEHDYYLMEFGFTYILRKKGRAIL